MSESALGRIMAFVNTRDLEDGSDTIGTRAGLAAWLAGHGLGEGARVTEADVARAAALREALRDHLLANNGAALPPQAVEAVDRQAHRSGVRLGFGAEGAELRVTAGGVEGSLGRLLVDVHAAMADGSWARLKACAADDCRWAFLDGSRNGSRHWCAMGVCGNREKARRYRARRRTS
ncbi:MAG: CGNR zinc finger domain-containing protein, partial [Thermoleophilia bacterium]|nr:CGNR zinc finger domain-containing protein [Thermoleophilia bacterium]MDH4346970.1 CGNR zinc finger domain-containing protein [Thermoleophilia bacterium]